jgi:hypothetical protein
MRLWMLSILIGITTFNVSACTEASCMSNARDWPFNPPLVGAERSRWMEVTVRPDGAILWNGSGVDASTLRQYLRMMHDGVPPPAHVVLRPTPESDCAALEAVREIMERAQMCRGGYCVEGSVWDKWYYRDELPEID